MATKSWSLTFLAVLSAYAQNYTIGTIAGQGLTLGDGATALSARFGVVSAVALGPDGSLYIADAGFHQIRKVAVNGSISLFAGGSVRGFGGDGGPATAALLNTPTALAVDSSGNVYIGDSGNHRVRMVGIYGNIHTVAGNGQVAPSPALSPVLPGEGGPATAAPLNQISGLAFASNGDLVIADIGNARIFRISNGNIKTLAGNGTTPASIADQPALPATLGAPSGVVTDYLGNVYFSDQTAGIVRMIDTKGNMTRIIGTGNPTDTPVSSGSPLSYPLLQPAGLMADSSFNIYVIEAGRVSIYMPASFASGAPASIQAVAGDITQKVKSATGDGGPALSAGMNPRSVAVDSRGTIYVADSLTTLDFHNRVRVVSNGTIATFAGGTPPTGTGDKGAATSAQLSFPRAIAIDSKGTVYIADTGDNRVRAVTSDGKINAFAGTGNPGTSGDQGSALLATLNPPQGIAIDGNANLYITDGSLIRQVNSGGVINTFAGGGASVQEGAPALSAQLTQAGSLAVDSQNNIYVDQFARVSEVSASNQTINTVAGTGKMGYSGDNGPAAAAQIDDVAGVAVDANGNLYIADEDNGRVRKVDTTGAITTFAGGGMSTSDGANATDAALNIPLGVAVDGTGNVYIAEYGGNRVRVVSPAGTIRTIAGNGLQGFSGDGGAATNASLSGPTDVKVDAQGNVYIADSLNSSIRKLTPAAMAPVPLISTVTNAADLAGGPVAPGERVTLTGTSLGPNSTVFFDSTAAPVLSSSVTSTLVVVPYEIASQAISQVTVKTGGVTSAPFAVQIAASAPGIYTQTGDGLGQAVAYLGDGSLNSGGNPVQDGSVIRILCTGEGLVSPAAITGVPIGQSPPSPVLLVSATIDGQTAQVNQAYSVPGTVGQFLVELIPPDGVSDQSASVQIMVGNGTTQIATIAVVGVPDDSSDLGQSRKRGAGLRKKR